MNPGGKGANQAITVSRLNGKVIFISKLGDDIFGKELLRVFATENIDTRFVPFEKSVSSGIALITVDKNGENSISVAPGANASITIADIEKALPVMAAAKIVLLQLEIPMEVVEYVAAYAATNGIQVILNPAPGTMLSSNLLRHVDIITPNETEAAIISGIGIHNEEDLKKAIAIIHQKGAKTVIVTMGSKGALLYHDGVYSTIETPSVKAIDTTAAGDVFNGALTIALSEGKNLTAAVRFANEAAAISVTRMGAQASIPYREELTN